VHGDGGADRVTENGRLELAAATLLTLATVATAWSGYQSSRWHGRQAEDFARASATRLESTRASALGNRNAQIDVATFTQWVDAYARKETELAAFYRKRFRAEFKPAVEAWILTRPLKNPDAPLTPFAMPEYKLAASEEADRLETTASAASEEAKVDIQRADNYVLCVVLFATSLFFGGISARMTTRAARVALLCLGLLVFTGTLVWLATFPVSIAV
jgi:hypothetical protein